MVIDLLPRLDPDYAERLLTLAVDMDLDPPCEAHSARTGKRCCLTTHAGERNHLYSLSCICGQKYCASVPARIVKRMETQPFIVIVPP